MRKFLTLIGATTIVGTGMVLAGAAPQQVSTTAAPKAAPTQAKAAAAGPEDQGIRAAFGQFLDAYSKADAKGMSEAFTEDGVLIDSSAIVTKGREAIAQQYADTFALNDGKSMPATAKIDTISLLTSEVARVEGTFALQETDGVPGYGGVYRALAVKKDGKWLIAEIRDDPAPVTVPESNEEYLKELEWMVGDWVDESETSKVSTSIGWAEKKNFLVRKYSVEVNGEPSVTGTQYIGYDPLSGQIKSWAFDSEGGHGEGYWTRSGENQWVIRASGVLRDGTTNSATLVVQQTNKDSVRMSTMDRIVGGVIVPEVDEIVMVRKPPAPSAAK